MIGAVKRRFYCGRAQGPIHRFLSSEPQPLGTPIKQARLLAVDLELTGLDQRKAEVISLGYVPVDGLRIQLSGARRILVRPQGSVEGSAHIHMIRDEDLTNADTIETALEELLHALEGRALLVHFAGLDHRVLSRLCRHRWAAPLIVHVVDTLALAYRTAMRTGQEPKQGSLRLPALRAQYGLPVAHLHGALSDAVATAELFLAMAAEHGLQSRLKDFCVH